MIVSVTCKKDFVKLENVSSKPSLSDTLLLRTILSRQSRRLTYRAFLVSYCLTQSVSPSAFPFVKPGNSKHSE